MGLGHYGITWRFLVAAAVFVGQWQCYCYEDELCFERSSCAVWYYSDLPPNCQCDTFCYIFDDCCVDAAIYAYRESLATSTGYNLTEIHKALTCRVSYVVNKCPEHSDEMTKQRCETYSELSQDVLAAAPVSGTSTGLVFKNIFCARCHGAILLEEVLIWQLAIDCGQIGDYNYYSQFTDVEVVTNVTKTLLTLFRNQFNYCDKYFLPPEELADPRTCQSIIDHCPEDWVDNQIAENCSSHNNYTYYGRISYKNRFCAICNDVPEEMLSCVGPKYAFDQREIPSMRFLLDLNRGKLSQLNDAGDGSMQQTGEALLLSNCPGETMIDLSHSLCRPVICETGGYSEDTECRPSSILSTEGDHQQNVSTNNVSCTLMSLNISEYEQHENGTLHIFHLGVVLHPGEYVQHANGSDVDIAVCASQFAQQHRPDSTKTSSNEKYAVEAYLTLIGYTLSLFGLLILFIVYMLLPERRNLPGKCLMNLVAALFMAQLLFLLINTPPAKSTLCLVYSALTHFMYLVAFFWMNVLGFDIWHTFQFQSLSHHSHQSLKLLIGYHLYAWGMPAIVVSIAVLVDQAVIYVPYDIKPGYGDVYCWFNNGSALLWFFAAPVGLLLAANTVFFSLSIYSICRISCATSGLASHQHSLSKRQHLLLNIKLSAIMGVTWTFGFLANLLPDSSVLWYIFVVCGSLQGVVICIGFVCNPKTISSLKARMKIPESTNTAKSSLPS